MANKLEKMQRFLPGVFKPDTNPNIRGLLYAWSGEDDKLVQACIDAKEQIFVKTARLQYLDALGSNVGVFRPTAVNLADDAYRQLIPALSFHPKQVVPTIKKVLDVFFMKDNPRVSVHEIRPNEVIIQIPTSVPSLRRTLKGSLHMHCYSGVINTIDNIGKTMTVTLDCNGKKVLKAGELKQAKIGQGLYSVPIQDNAEGWENVLIQFPPLDLSKFQAGQRFMMSLKNYPGSYMPDPRKPYTVTMKRGILGQTISKDQTTPVLIMEEASGIPDKPGLMVIGMGTEAEEAEIKYFSRPNNTTLLIDPSYKFLKDHSIGEAVNVIVKPYQVPRVDGRDYSVYVVGVTAARILAQQIIESVVAAGVVVKWIVVEPKIE